MAKTKISEFSTTPGNNTDINGINIAEGCAPSGINNAIRELMSDLKEWQSGAMDVYVIPQGTAAAPGIQLYGDLDTGLYGYAANQLGVAVGGASAGYFSSAGWVGNVNGTITGDINATTIDTTNLEVTNIKAKDGTAAITIADSTGVVSVSTQLAVDNLNLSGNTLSSSDTNGNIILAPNGTGDVYLDADTIRVGDSNTNVTITSNGTADLILNTNSGTNSGSITIQDGVNGNILIATNGTGQIQLTGDLDVANIETGAIKARDGTASATIADSTGVMTIASSVLTTTDINGGTIDNTVIGGATTAAGSFTTLTATQLDVDNLRFDANTISSTNTNGNIQIAPAGTGDVYLDADTVRIGDLNSNATLTTNGAADLILNTNSGSLSGSITIQDGVNGNIVIAPNGTGQVQLSGALDVTDIEVTNIKAKDGTAALSIADSTGAVTVATALTANGGAVFNENGADVDFRVESDTDTHCLFVDASANNVGIGTSSPAAKLQVNAANFALGTSYATLTDNFAIRTTDSQAANVGGMLALGGFNIGTSSASDFVRLHGKKSNSTSGNVSGYFAIEVADDNTGPNYMVERLRLDSSGNLGLGVTPSAWKSEFKVLQLNARTSLFGSADSTFLSTNEYIDSAGTSRYIQTGSATRYRQDDRSHIWSYAASGTAGNAITFTQAMTLHASGGLSLGDTTDPGATNLRVAGQIFAIDASRQLIRMRMDSNIAKLESTYFSGAGGAYQPLAFYTSDTERARITSGGDFLTGGKTSVGFTTSGAELRQNGLAAFIRDASSATLYVVKPTATHTTGNMVEFRYNDSTTVGTISYTSSSVAYNTSSDYRLKDNQQPLTGSGDFIDALKPKTWDWKAGGKGVGFIAHEVQAVSPGSVVGEKDAVDADGNPIMQAMEYGSAEFIANIIAELQSLRARVAQLEGK